MAVNYLNNLNKIVKINSATVTNASNKDALVITSRRNRDDLNNISSYINSIVYPAFTMLCSKPRYPYDVLESGLSGMTIVTYPEEQGNNKFNTELFWKPGVNNSDGRPCTIKESFDYIMANMVEKVVEISQATVDLNDLWDAIRCNTLNNSKVAKDAFGTKYNLNCSDDPSLEWPLARHLYEIFNQVISGHTQDSKVNLALDPGTGEDNYPTLSVTANVEPATTEVAGVVEIATPTEIGALAQKANSTTGNHQLVLTPHNLHKSLDIDGSGFTNRRDNLLREKVKEVALEKINESSITQLADVNTYNNIKDGYVLVYDSTAVDDTSAADQDDPVIGSWVPRPLNQGDLEGSIEATSKLGIVGSNSTIDDMYSYHSQIPNDDKATNINLIWSKLFNQWTKRGPEFTQGLNSRYRNLSNRKIYTKTQLQQDPTLSTPATYYKNIPYVFKAAPYSKLMRVNSPMSINYIKSSFVKFNTNIAFLNEDLELFEDLNVYFSQNSCSKFTKNLNNEHGVISSGMAGSYYAFKYDYVCNYFDVTKVLGVCRSDLDFKAVFSNIVVDDGISKINYIDNNLIGLTDSSVLNESVKHYSKSHSLTSQGEEVLLNYNLADKQDFIKRQFLYQFGKSNSQPISTFRTFITTYQGANSLHGSLSLTDISTLQNNDSTPGVSSNNVTIQSDGVSKIMILGPYEMGDNIYICPESILDIRNIEGSVGVVISESFMNKTLLELMIEFIVGQEKDFSKYSLTGQEVFDYFAENLSSNINYNYTNVQNLWSKTLQELLFDNVDLGLSALQKISFKEEVGTIVNSHDWSLGLIGRKDEIAFGMNAFCENLLEINNNNTNTKYAAGTNPSLNQNYYEDLIDYLYFSIGFKTIDTALNVFNNTANTLQQLAVASSYTKKNLFLRRLRSLNLVDIQILT
jgi:hypothetical protein